MRLTKGQRALVTGASRGLGVDIARRLAERGLDVVLVARSADALETVARRLRAETGANIICIALDLVGERAAADLAEETAQLGGVDVLVNNAGMESTLSFDMRDASDINQTIAVNLSAPMVLTRALLPGMIARGRGHIVNIASVAGVIAVPYNEPYVASKYGLIGFTRSIRLTARACGWRVSASSVCPGFIDGAGMFEELKQTYSVSSEGLDARSVESVGPAVIEAIEGDLSEVYVAGGNVREVAALSISQPDMVEAGTLTSATTAMFRSIAEARKADLLKAKT